MKVTIQDGRTLVGTLMAFDKYMNLVLGDCEESRRIKSKKAAGGSELLGATGVGVGLSCVCVCFFGGGAR
jgi:small nuclear ribonucleoprotein (snRNP)-like protein